MKKTEIFYILLGVIIGNALSLILTLHLWGSAWWQVAIAIITGTFIGAMVTDFKIFKEVIIESRKESISILENIFSIALWKSLWYKISWKRVLYLIHNIFLLIFIIALFIGYGSIYLFYLNKVPQSGLAALLLTTIVVLLWFYSIIALINYPIRTSTLKKTFEEYSYIDESHTAKYNSKSEILSIALCSLPFNIFLKKLWYAKWLDFAWMWKDALYTILFVAFTITLALIAWLPLTIFVSLKNILKYSQLLLVFLGVATGTITGVFTTNIVFGLVAGVIPVFLAILFNMIASEFKYKDANKVFEPIQNLI